MTTLKEKCERFVSHVYRFRSCCTSIETQYARARLRVTDVELVYSSSFLSVCAQWEALLEEIIFEAVCGQMSRRRQNRRLVEIKNRAHLRALLLYPGKSYLSINGIKQAEELASLFVASGAPFSAVAAQNRTYIQQAGWIRNAIAHQSKYAIERFRRDVPGVGTLPTPKRFPGPFLRHEFRVAPAQRRYEIYFWAYQSAAREVAEAW